MAGIRIHHTNLKDCTLVVRHPGGGRPSGAPAGAVRRPKDYHIHLDANGDSIVSETVWLRLQEAQRGGSPHQFVVLNEVPDPPDLIVGDATAQRKVRTFVQTPDGVRDAELQSIAQTFAPRGITPRITPSQ